MSTYIALLRAVNLAGRNAIAMARLRGMCADLGLSNVRTLLQSGNLVFKSRAGSDAALERRLETTTAAQLGVTTEFFVRSAREWASIVAANPFPERARSDPGHLLLVAFKDAVTEASVVRLREAISGRELVEASGRHAYVVYPDGVGRSRLTMALIERTLATRGTARNWSTVLKLLALTAE